MDQVDCVVVGAGVVGLAVARALAQAGREVLVLDAAEGIGTETSSRNSEVIHAGIYYKAGSLMAQSCVAGKWKLYEYCESHGVAHRNCGKLIVATSDAEAEQLEGIRQRAAANGVDDLRFISGAEARTIEPSLTCTAALVSPSTGIIDSHAYMLALQGDAEDAGAMFAFHAPMLRGRATASGRIEIEVGGAEPMALSCNLLVNSAGLHAPALARGIEGLDPAFVPPAYFAKGNYFSLALRSPFSRLIYPVPVPGGLGTHLTIDLGGQARFGPDVEWIDHIDYNVDPRRGELFYASIRRWWPELPDGALAPGYSGIRPKTVPKGAPGQDFLVQGAAVHGLPGLVNLFGIESPGLTASLSLAEHVMAAIGNH